MSLDVLATEVRFVDARGIVIDGYGVKVFIMCAYVFGLWRERERERERVGVAKIM